MEDSTLAAGVAAGASPTLPEALQPPTQPVRIGFMLGLALANAALYLCFVGIGALLLPLQISTIDPARKVINLGIVSSIAVLLALIGNPLAGALSDRTTSRFGRRRPWIFGGASASVLALALMMSAHALTTLFAGYAIFQLSSNCVLAALAAIIPDQIPETQRGTISGAVGLATSVGSIFGAVVIGLIIKAPGPSYWLLIILLLAILIPFALLLRESALPRAAVPSFRVGAFLRNFWVDPRKHPDFGWAWLTRFVPVFGYSLGTGYLFFYLQDAVHYERLFPGQTTEQGVSTLTIISTLSAIVFTVLGGVLSDRIRRRKPFIIMAYCLVAGTLAVFAVVPPWPVLLVDTAVLGVGFGTYIAVDAALVTQVLPSANNRAKDLGIVNIANTLPQSLAPAVAVFIVSASHSYFALYATGAIILLLGILVVRPIKAVR